MKRVIILLVILNTLVLLFHIAILLKIIPYTIAWGGKLKSDADMYKFEVISVSVNLLFTWVLLHKGRFIRQSLGPKLINVLLWIFLVMYLLNTVGNLFAITMFEKCFAVLTLIFSLLIVLLLRYKKR